MPNQVEQELTLDHALWCGKMSAEPCPSTTEETSLQSLKKQSELQNRRPPIFMSLEMAGLFQELMWVEDSQLRGEFSTLNFGESPNVVVESRLSQILQADVPRKYYLSPIACTGILNRAKRRGKDLPEMLRIALENQAKSGLSDSMDTTDLSPEDQALLSESTAE